MLVIKCWLFSGLLEAWHHIQYSNGLLYGSSSIICHLIGVHEFMDPIARVFPCPGERFGAAYSQNAQRGGYIAGLVHIKSVGMISR